MARWITVFHTTGIGNGKKIVDGGWQIQANFLRGQLYGRGIYFWERMQDAHMFGDLYFTKMGERYEIVSEEVPYRNVLTYDFKKRAPNNSDADFFSRQMLKSGYEMIEIPRAYMDDTTMRQASGKAYVWLVDINVPFKKIQ